MPPLPTPSRDELEWRVLQWLVSRSFTPHPPAEALLLSLRREDFANPEHRAVFEELAHATERGLSVQQFHHWLPAAMTRRGLPDLNFSGLFQPSPPDSPAGELSELVRQLRDRSSP